MIQVYGKENGTEEFDAKKEEETPSNTAANIVARQLINDLYQNAGVVDNRYLYF